MYLIMVQYTLTFNNGCVEQPAHEISQYLTIGSWTSELTVEHLKMSDAQALLQN